MDQQSLSLLAALKRSTGADQKLAAFNALKSDIKHYRVPESAQATIFDCIKLAITQQASSTLASSAFSTLGHLIKRLKIQDASGTAIVQLAPRLFPALHERLGDLREPLRTAASQALSELYPFCAGDVEQLVRDEAIGGTNPRAKEAGMRWVVRMHNDEAMPFKAYVSSMVARVEDADGNVREAAKSVLIELFRNAPDRAKTDLKRQLKAHSVRHSIESQILAQIGGTAASQPATTHDPEPTMTGSTRSLPTSDPAARFADSISSEAAQPPPPEVVPMDPIYVHTQRELEDIFRDMSPCFEGREDEGNWMPRDKSILKMRRILKGNAPNEFQHAFMAGIKSLVEGIIKASSSLRTTMSTNGCQLVQELSRTLGPALDPHVEVLLQCFMKMSAATKHIAAENGRTTADVIFQNCSYNARMMQHIWYAMQEKNAQSRQCATEWLRTIIRRQASYKQHFDSSGGLELAEKCIKKGLDDANPKVKEGTRGTYWMFAKTWPDRAEAIMSKLDPKSKTALERDSNNPNAALHVSHLSVPSSGRASGTTSRNTLRELMAEQRKAKAAGKLPERPNSAMADFTPARSKVSAPSATAHGPSHLRSESRNVSTTSTASHRDAEPSGSAAVVKKGGLMAGPVRRPRRPEIQRPQTADPYASKRLLRPETPANGSPTGTPHRGTAVSKTSTATHSTARSRAKTAGNVVGSISGTPTKHTPSATYGKSQHGTASGLDSRPTSKGSTATNHEDLASIREDESTFNVNERKGPTAAGRDAFLPGHKRPSLGQTMSVDSGIPAMTDDEGFTMVLPSFPSNQPRPRSPLAYRSPMKAMFDDARERVGKLSPEAQRQMRMREESNGGSTNGRGSPVRAPGSQADEVQVYEDPFTDEASGPSTQEERKVLGELPINENVRLASPTQSVGSSQSPAGSPPPVRDARSLTTLSPEDRAEVMKSKKLLISGIERIRSKTLDAHGFRKLQDLAKSRLDIWDEGKKYHDLMAVLLEYLQTIDQDAKLAAQSSKLAGLKAQALGSMRALLTLHRKYATAWHAKALVTILICRKGVEGSSHLSADLQRAAEEIIQSAAPEACIDGVLDSFPAISRGSTSAPQVAMGLVVLRQLVGSSSSSKPQHELGGARKVRVARLAAKHLGDADSEVRKADVDLASELFDTYSDDTKGDFWAEFQTVDESRLGLLTYYIAKRGKSVAA